MTTLCQHTVTSGRESETGSWCEACGEKTLAVDERECKDCAHHRRLIDGSICKRHMMAVLPSMHVTYKISEGTCWTLPSPAAGDASQGEKK